MVTKEDLEKIRYYWKNNKSVRWIEAETGINRGRVWYYIVKFKMKKRKPRDIKIIT